jgi:hypothetical protein
MFEGRRDYYLPQVAPETIPLSLHHIPHEARCHLLHPSLSLPVR